MLDKNSVKLYIRLPWLWKTEAFCGRICVYLAVGHWMYSWSPMANEWRRTFTCWKDLGPWLDSYIDIIFIYM